MDLALQAAFPESGGDEDAVGAGEEFRHVLRRDVLALDGPDVHLAVVGRAGMDKGLLDGLVGVLEFHIFADEDDLHLVGGVSDTVEEGLPAGEFGLVEVLDLEFPDGEFIEMLLMHVQGNLVDAPGVDALDNVAGPDVAEEGDLPAEVLGEGMLGAADDDVGLHTALLERLHGMLGRLGLQFLGGTEVGDQREVDGHAVLLREFPLQLTDRFHEGLRLHVADSAADFGEDDVIVARLAEEEHPPLDFVRDVGDDLDGLAQVRALALAGNDGIVDPSGRHIVGLGGMDAEETFVVTEVEVGLRAVFGDVAFPVLVGIERSGVDVDVGIEFLDGDSEAPGLQEFC